jgi:hypothetical protein
VTAHRGALGAAPGLRRAVVAPSSDDARAASTRTDRFRDHLRIGEVEVRLVSARMVALSD